MGDITLAYLYPDSSVLDVPGHNNNIHSSDTSVREGLMSTANGYLTTENLVSGFTVRKHHVMQKTPPKTPLKISGSIYRVARLLGTSRTMRVSSLLTGASSRVTTGGGVHSKIETARPGQSIRVCACGA